MVESILSKSGSGPGLRSASGSIAAQSRAHAQALDENDSLKEIRNEFLIPTKADLQRKTLARGGEFLRASEWRGCLL